VQRRRTAPVLPRPATLLVNDALARPMVLRGAACGESANRSCSRCIGLRGYWSLLSAYACLLVAGLLADLGTWSLLPSCACLLADRVTTILGFNCDFLCRGAVMHTVEAW
jgi:hypothetical protein